MSLDHEEKWDLRFLQLAEVVASWSKDPSTQVGAVLVRPNKTIASVGFNGFPRHVSDDPKLYEDRTEKYPRIVHAEVNAILMAKEDLSGYTIYVTPLFPCSTCAGIIIQSGITRVVGQIVNQEGWDRWMEANSQSEKMFAEAGMRTTTHVKPTFEPSSSQS